MFILIRSVPLVAVAFNRQAFYVVLDDKVNLVPSDSVLG